MQQIAKEIDSYSDGSRVIERKTMRKGTAHGTGLGGMTMRGFNRLCLTVNVKWDDGKEYAIDSRALDPA